MRPSCLPGTHKGEARQEPELCASGGNRGLSLGHGAGWCWDSPVMCLQSRWDPAWGGLERIWQDFLPREELDQDRLPEGVGWEWAWSRVVPLPNGPWR